MTHGTHVTDDDLILHFYGEAPNEAPRIDGHLANCEACRANWTSLTRTLQMVDSAEVPEAPEGFERVIWAKVREQLPPAAAAAPARPAFLSWRVWAPVAGLAAVVLVAFLGGRLWRGAAPAPATPAPSGDTARLTRELVLLTALETHFDDTEQLLVELKNAPDAKGVDVTATRAAARELVASNRLYRETAATNGDAQLATVLEDLERVLVDVAGTPDHVNVNDLQSLRARIEDDSLLFKVRALGSAVRQREQALSPVSARTL